MVRSTDRPDMSIAVDWDEKHQTKLVVSFHQMGCTNYGEGNTSPRHDLASIGLFVVLCVWVLQPFDIN